VYERAWPHCGDEFASFSFAVPGSLIPALCNAQLALWAAFFRRYAAWEKTCLRCCGLVARSMCLYNLDLPNLHQFVGQYYL
jgi:hypothetical protein